MEFFFPSAKHQENRIKNYVMMAIYGKESQTSAAELLKFELTKALFQKWRYIFFMIANAQKQAEEISKKSGLFSGLTAGECKMEAGPIRTSV